MEAAMQVTMTTPLLIDEAAAVPAVMKKAQVQYVEVVSKGESLNAEVMAPPIANSMMVNSVITMPKARISHRL